MLLLGSISKEAPLARLAGTDLCHGYANWQATLPDELAFLLGEAAAAR